MRKITLFISYLRRLGLYNFADYIFQRFIKKNEILSVTVPSLPYKVTIRNNSSDIPLFGEMFIREEYNVPITNEVSTIIDCGANVGLASLFFLSKYPKARIFAVEPEENNFALLTKNLGNYENVVCLKKAIWNTKTNLEIIDHGLGNHAFIIRESGLTSEISIEAISIYDIMNEYNLKEIDILKIDIEGSEEKVFSEKPSWLNKVHLIFCEIHESLKPGLTKKILDVTDAYFNYSIKGEYYVFQRKE